MRACLCFSFFVFLPLSALAEGQVSPEFQVLKITRNLVSAPQFVYTGAQQYPTNQRDRWLEVEVEFSATPVVTDDLTLNYLILINGILLSGEVTHTNVGGDRENRSVMYASPRVLARFTGNRAMTANAVQNICVQITQRGMVKDELSLIRAQSQWYEALPRIKGLLLTKNETPFAPLYWDRYAQIKISP
jgi:hypothetical protein